ncbi:hypothetical protein BGX29_006241 [Mortierella sp. GBA35]|nr:hypothetical protein BGX29_006241 [Mortierella sp. GBA35]
MSLDLFKVPFNLNKNRRATCAASDLKRMLMAKTSSVLASRRQKKEDDGNDGAAMTNEILKTSSYHPDEQDKLRMMKISATSFRKVKAGVCLRTSIPL